MHDSNTSGSNGASAPAQGTTPAAQQSPIKQALAAIRDLRAQLDAVQARETEPIAIVGMACRYPGCADLASFWRLLVDGRDAVTEVPADRWSLDALYDPDPSRPGKMTSRWAGVIDRLDEFDAAFFGISPREAPHVDPRQRLALELMWEALEDASIPPDSLAGTFTGVFMATLTNDYDHLLFDDLRRADAYSGAGTANSIVANRLSYFLDVRGPSLALDTACSGSLVAVHLACESLRRGESTLALAGGVNVNLMPKSNVFFSKAGALSPSGRCKTFDGRADGMVRSDGAGLIVLKRLSDARRDGDRVIAVIKGSAVNHDGRSNGLMAPNGDAQRAVLTEAYRRAGVAPASVQYIEAHGTGTKLGDPIEVQALGDVLAADRPADRKCLLGSLKTNIGHTEAAAGIGGLIKTALALRHRVIPPAVHFRDPNPLIPFGRLPFEVPREATAWPSPDAPLVAGVSGFGFGGTNAHVVLQDASSATATATAAASVTGVGMGAHATSASANADLPAEAVVRHNEPPYLLALSARTPGALRQLAEGFRDRLIAKADVRGHADDTNANGANGARDARDTDDTGDICASAALGRTHHRAYRLAVAADSSEALVAALSRRLGEIDGGAASATGAAPKAAAPKAAVASAAIAQGLNGSGGRLVFVFSGQGSHWPRMGQRLAAREPVFKAALDECDRLFAPLLNASIVEEIAREASASRLNETALTQPAIFSMQIALVALWRSFGVTPDAVIGHSLGEVAAACAAGVITLEEGVRIVYHRSRLMTRAAGRGRTIVTGLSFDEAREMVRPFEPALAVAGSNGPGTSVIAGDPASIAELTRALESRGTFCREIKGVDIAFHSPQMDPLRDELVATLSGASATASATAIAPRVAKIPIVSTVTGTWASGDTFDAAYWGRNLRDPFLFARAIGVLLGDGGGIRACIEISPDAVLSSSIAQCARQAGQPSLPILSSMRRATDEPLHLFEQVARLYELGEPLQWRGAYRTRERHASVPLPTYPWQRQRFWFDQLTPAEPTVARVEPTDARRADASAADAVIDGAHPLLGEAIEPATETVSASASTGDADRDRVCLWQFEMDAERPGWVADHKVLGDVMVPGAAMLELAIAAARQVWSGADPARASTGSIAEASAGTNENAGVSADGMARIAVTAMTFDQPIRLDVPRRIQVALTISGDEAGFTLHSRAAGSRDAWTKHATARVSATAASAKADTSERPAASTIGTASVASRAVEPLRDAMPAAAAGAKADATERPAASTIEATSVAGRIVEPLRDAMPGAATAAEAATSDRAEDSSAATGHSFESMPERAAQTGAPADTAAPTSDAASVGGRVQDQPHGAPFAAAAAEGPSFESLPERTAPIGVPASLDAHYAVMPAATASDGNSFESMPERAARIGVAMTVEAHYAAMPATDEHSFESMPERAARIGALASVDAHYAAMSADGLEYGPAFRGIQRLWASDGEALAEIQLPSAAGACDARYAMHPAMLDAAFQTVAAAVGQDDRQRYLPRGVARWQVFDAASGDRVWCHVRVNARGPEGLTADIDLLNDDGRLVARVDGLSLVRFGAPRRNPLEDALLEERWQPRELAAASDASRQSQARAWLILADGTGVGEALTARLRANGERVTVARWGTAWRQHDAHIEVRAGERGDMDRLLAAATSASGRIDHVVHLWSLDTRSPAAYSDCETAIAALDTGETLAAGSALHLAQALVQAGSTARLWLTTRGTQAVNPQAVNPHVLNSQGVNSHGVNSEGVKPQIGSPRAGSLHVGNSPALNAFAVSSPAASSPAVSLPAVSLPAVSPAAANAQAVDAPVSNTPELNRPVANAPAGNAPAGSTPAVNLLASNFRTLRNASIEIQQAGVNGLALTIGQEHPELRCTTIDLDGASRAPAQVTSLTAELLADDRETRVAWRRGTRYAARLVPASWPREATRQAAESPRVLPLHGDATYLITGGLGALGLRTAMTLARLGARRLVLTGRRGPESMGDAAAASIRAIEATGAAVTIARADISVAADADSLFADVLSKLPPLRGVIHAAGVLDDALIAQQSIDRLRTAMAPKMRGTWNLHVHTRSLPIDFFVCYSSAASLVGSPGQANYAAGNACMDAIAHHRRALGLPASSINWGAWGEEGMAANPQMHARLAARGVTPIATSDGLALLSRLLRDTIARGAADADADAAAAADTADAVNAVNVADADADANTNTSDRAHRQAAAERPAVFGVMPVTWRTFLKHFPADVPSRFDMLAAVAASEAVDASSASASSDAAASSDSSDATSSTASASTALQALRTLTPHDRRRRLQQMLRDTLAAVLGFGAPLELGPREKYFDLGMDSLLSVEFRNRLQQTFAIALPATLAFDYPTIETLAEHIDTLLAERFQSDASVSASAGAHTDGANGANGTSDASGAIGTTVLPGAIAAAAATRDSDDADAEALDVLPTDEIARLLAAELSEEAVRVR